MAKETYDPTETVRVELDSEELKYLSWRIKESLQNADLWGKLSGIGPRQRSKLRRLLEKIRAGQIVLKNKRFHVAYGTGPRRLLKVTGLSAENVKGIVEEFNKTFPGILSVVAPPAVPPSAKAPPRPKKGVSKRPRKPQERSKSFPRGGGPSGGRKA
jgi:hypothetical protein